MKWFSIVIHKLIYLVRLDPHKLQSEGLKAKGF